MNVIGLISEFLNEEDLNEARTSMYAKMTPYQIVNYVKERKEGDSKKVTGYLRYLFANAKSPETKSKFAEALKLSGGQKDYKANKRGVSRAAKEAANDVVNNAKKIHGYDPYKKESLSPAEKKRIEQHVNARHGKIDMEKFWQAHDSEHSGAYVERNSK